MTRPRLVVVNQTVSREFCAWLAALATTIGPLELWTGNPPRDLPAGVAARRAPAYNRSSTAARLATWAAFTLVAGWWLLVRSWRVPVLVVSNPPLMILLAGLLCRLQRRRLGLLEWDIYPQVLAASGLGRGRVGRAVYGLWRVLHGHALRVAAAVITIGPRMAGELRCLAGDPELPVAVVPNWVDTGWMRPLPAAQNPFRQARGLDDELLVLYSGNLGASHSIETILDVARELAGEDGIRFLVAGDGAKRHLVAAAVAAGQVPNLELLSAQPLAALPAMLAAAQVGIVTLADGFEGLSMPSKTYNLMAAGCAILGISRPPNDLAAAIEAHGVGANFGPDAPAAIAGWLRALAADREELARLQCLSRQAAVDSYDQAICYARLNQVVRAKLLPAAPAGAL